MPVPRVSLRGATFQVVRLLRVIRAECAANAQVERVTNHDVKAIEYVMKRRLHGNAELAKV